MGPGVFLLREGKVREPAPAAPDKNRAPLPVRRARLGRAGLHLHHRLDLAERLARGRWAVDLLAPDRWADLLVQGPWGADLPLLEGQGRPRPAVGLAAPPLW